MFFACSTVKFASDVSNIGISEITIDYFHHDVIGRLDSIFFLLTMEEQVDMAALTNEMDKNMNLAIGPEGQLITVPKIERATRLAIMALLKLRKFDRIKIVGAGGAINPAVQVALMLTQGNLAKEPLAVERISLSTVSGREEGSKPTTGINIYLSKGKKTTYSNHHKELLEDLKTGKL